MKPGEVIRAFVSRALRTPALWASVGLLLIALAVVLPHSESSPARVTRGVESNANLEGWQNTRWGMTREEVSAAWPVAQDILMPDYRKPSNPPGTAFGIPDFKIGNCSATVFFGFKADKLEYVSFHLKPRNARNCVMEIREDIIGRYGAPASEKVKSGGNDLHVEWLVGGTRIYLGMVDLPAQNATVGGLHYEARPGG